MLPQLYEKFRSWSEGGSVWIYSDPHFDDADCKLIAEDWPTPDEQIEKINKKVHKNDTLVILGDVGNKKYIKRLKAGYKVLITGNHDGGASSYKKTIFSTSVKLLDIKYTDEEQYQKDVSKEIAEFRKYLSDNYPYAKINIQEVHDFLFPFQYLKPTIDNNLFDEVYTGPLFIGEKLLLSHEPIDIPFALNIHGHTHDRVGYGFHDLNHFNVCSNTVGYEPQNLKDIISSGFLKNIETIHRITIDKATENSKNKGE